MPRTNPLLCLASLCLVLLAVPAAPAGPVSWTYGWSTDAGTLAADPGGNGTITLLAGPGGTQSGPAVVDALGFTTLTAATDQQPDHFSGQSYNLTLGLTDNTAHASGTLNFLGSVNGTLSAANDNLFLGFDHLGGVLNLGGDRFNVTLALPPQPGLGIISAQVNVAQGAGGGTPPPGPRPGPEPGPQPGPQPGPGPGPQPGPQSSPEPSALILAALGLSGVVVGAWRRRRTRAAG